MNVAVAGPDGFIGRRAVAALAAAGHAITRWTRAELAALTAPGAPRPTAVLDAVVWCAGRREPDLAANHASHVALPLAALAASGARRIVYLSSGEVYGAAPLPYREAGPTLGTSDYARAKLAAEAALPAVAHTAVLRLGLVYGANGRPPMLIPRVVAALRADQRLPLTHGEQTRDLVFVDDVARAIVAAVAALAPLPAAAPFTAQTVNIASGTEVRIRDVVLGIADAIAAQTGRPAAAVRALLAFGEVPLRPDEATRYVLDVSRARDQLGWHATTSLAEGFAQL